MYSFFLSIHRGPVTHTVIIYPKVNPEILKMVGAGQVAREQDSISSTDEAPYTGLSDVLPVPATTEPVTNPGEQNTATSLGDKPTLSHSLAMEDHQEKGVAQHHREDEVVNLGWNEKKENIPAPLVGGIGNEDLWLLIRRFNKQMYHVKEVTSTVPGDLDLNVADEEEFAPDKLRATVERLYMSVIIKLLAAVKHVARLRSWRETRRTACFCLAYFVAWFFDLITPLIFTTLITLILYPKSRGVLFPPAPIPLVNSKTGGVQKPKAGVLGSHESATGAPENHKGEAVEQEASNFFNGFTAVVVTSATGKNPQADPEDSSADKRVPDPTHLAVSAAEAKDVAEGDTPGSAKKDKTKVPVENAIWSKMRPIMHGISDFTDTFERLANALSPTPPFPQETYRIRLAALVAPLLLVSLFTTSYLFVKGATFGIGFGFFGDPVITPGLRWLNTRYPNWQKVLEMRNTVLKGVPTNAQLTLTLLRIGEANKAPLPPPPLVRQPPPDRPAAVTDAELRATGAEPPLNATDAELNAAMAHDPFTAHETAGPDIDAAKGATDQHGHRHKGSRILGAIKGAVKGTVKSAIVSDAARAKVGSHHAKERLGAVPPAHEEIPATGPVDFRARYNGKKGRIYITTKSTIPAVGFSTDTTSTNHTKEVVDERGQLLVREEVVNEEEGGELDPKWSIAIGDIRELKKIGGYGWKAKLVVGWSLGREVNDGLEITDRRGNVRRITALPLRDELFNRLIAMGGQKWEAW
ncbi:hypothetical protein F5Y17DRAFT_412697 [Xylariaceae sp. FL0594]|nr:hypothetical protein F5Y17DRAFT_412697 [Xylariaceae sp. FL0594]